MLEGIGFLFYQVFRHSFVPKSKQTHPFIKDLFDVIRLSGYVDLGSLFTSIGINC